MWLVKLKVCKERQNVDSHKVIEEHATCQGPQRNKGHFRPNQMLQQVKCVCLCIPGLSFD